MNGARAGEGVRWPRSGETHDPARPAGQTYIGRRLDELAVHVDVDMVGPQFQSPLPSPTVTDSHQPSLGTVSKPNACDQRSSTLIYEDRLGDQEGQSTIWGLGSACGSQPPVLFGARPTTVERLMAQWVRGSRPSRTPSRDHRIRQSRTGSRGNGTATGTVGGSARCVYGNGGPASRRGLPSRSSSDSLRDKPFLGVGPCAGSRVRS